MMEKQSSLKEDKARVSTLWTLAGIHSTEDPLSEHGQKKGKEKSGLVSDQEWTLVVGGKKVQDHCSQGGG